MKQSKKITLFCTAMLASMTLFAANDLMSNQAMQAVKAASSLTVSSSINSYILNSKFAVSSVTKELHTFEMFNYSTSDKKPNGIVFHYTDNPNNYSARNEADYEINGGWEDAFVHTFIDASTILNIHDTDFGAWGGGPKANARFVQFELVTARNREEFAKSINNAAWYTASMAVKYNWTLTPATVSGGGTLWTHYDVTNYLGGTDHTDPIAYLAKWGYDTTQFMDLAKYYYSELTANANRGSFDKVSMTSNGLQISGWHAANETVGKKYSFLILMDANTNNEISRYRINRNIRNDVAIVYPKLYGASTSGFSYTVPLSANITNRNIKIISRYSSDPTGTTNYVDYWSKEYNFSRNIVSFDSVKVNNKKLDVTGWHAADGAMGRPYHYIILYNATDHKEIKRTLVNNIIRNDVEKIYPSVSNAKNSGFTTSFMLDTSLSGKKLQIISRYSDNISGEGNVVERWSNEYKFDFNQNHGSIDSVVQTANSIHVSGWNAADAAIGRDYSYLFLMDEQGKEIKRVPIQRLIRKDVFQSYPALFNSVNSGFSVDIPITSEMRGKTFKIKLRYSGEKTGSLDYVDTDFSPKYRISTVDKNTKQNKASLDNVHKYGENVTISGWHASDYSDGKPYRYLFLLDEKTGKEVKRYPIYSLNRPDVLKVYPNILNASKSGFQVNLPLDNSLLNRNLNVMVRYTNDIHGNGSCSDYKFSNILKF